MNIVTDDFIQKHGCKTSKLICKHLKIISIKDLDGEYRRFYHCVCSCCRIMERRK